MPITVAGYFFIGFVIILGYGSIIWLGIDRSFGRKVTGLYRTGPYRLTRNPQVLGGLIMASGIALLWLSWYALGWVVLWLFMFHFMVLIEGEHLQNRYGVEYECYYHEIPWHL